MMPYAPYVGPVRLGLLPAPSLPSKRKPEMGLIDPLGVGLAVEGTIVLASVAASAYHGYKRNRSVGWAAWWGFMGLLFPIVTPAVAIAQGFGKRSR
jgi:hypothetical protein